MIKGRCHCGSTVYTVSDDLGFQFICQCRSCQKLSSSGHLAGAVIQKSQFTLIGDTDSYTYIGGSGQKLTVFSCPTCRTSLYAELEVPNYLIIRAGTLDDQTLFFPKKIINRSEASPWDRDICQLPKND